MNNTDDNEVLSDVSLDEDDEELIWRVFYSSNEDKANEEAELDPNDEEVSDLSDIEDEQLVQKYKQLKEQETASLSEDDKKKLLITSFTEDQMDKFEAYRRMAVNKPGVKKICGGVVNQSIPQNMAIVLAGLSKSFLGDIVTKAFEIQEREYKAQLILDIDAKKRRKKEALKRMELGQDVSNDPPERKLEYMGDIKGPLQPEHVREAWRLYKLENSGAYSSQWRTQGERDGKLFR
ncbi:hypothetical protein FT663_01147 [Candidozyma haemuli var. vulneris]|uniref:TAFII28-like protein domain-containing protein n=1 Tax=Candidozyma haemuli TaxID=45357 RepID=A0A2V1AXQ7_9ASCO|nr:hypothetical protein CXQ85_004812 [[Candida] haemuloni]KAF3993734.1 hypothetical protein FT662_00447 [[Candida] haemuloni var. vulneris]KAF3994791.1 hypothetical protein FT663_01147 [[Candida] haemuloni var. vulneris]PVH22143.1 hypothetical protein CXQ85_004812 [[Candida] haemuloni]